MSPLQSQKYKFFNCTTIKIIFFCKIITIKSKK